MQRRPAPPVDAYAGVMDAWTPEQRRAFGRRLSDARKARGLTQDDVGAIFDVGKQAVSHWEVGRSVPSAEQLAILGNELGQSVDWLLFGQRTWPFPDDVSPADIRQLPEDLLQQATGALRMLVQLAQSRKQLASAA